MISLIRKRKAVKHKNFCIALFAFLASLAITTAVIAQVKAAPTVPPKTNTYADPARCKKRFDGTADKVPELLKCLYVPYGSDKTLMNAAPSTDAIAAIAAPHLRLLLEQERRCQLKRHEICALEQDILIWAQDISNFALRAVDYDRPSGIATVTILNGGDITFVYFRFSIERKRLLLDDIEYSLASKSTLKESLVKTLRTFDYGR